MEIPVNGVPSVLVDSANGIVVSRGIRRTSVGTFSGSFPIEDVNTNTEIATGQTLTDIVVSVTDIIGTRAAACTGSSSRTSELTGVENIDSEIWLRLTIVQLDPIGMRIEI